MKVSIAMASYNGARFLVDQLESLADQKRLPDELIVCDDNSDDQTFAILTDFASKVPFDVKIFRNQKRMGYVLNFSEAMNHCSGDIVFLCDQDDYWFPDKIARIVDLAETMPNIQLFMNDAIITDENLKPTDFTKLGQNKAVGYPHTYFVTGCCCAIRRELLDICLPIPNIGVAHDSWIAMIANTISTKYLLEDALQYYRRHNNNVSQTITSLARKITSIDRLRLKVKLRVRHHSAFLKSLFYARSDYKHNTPMEKVLRSHFRRCVSNHESPFHQAAQDEMKRRIEIYRRDRLRRFVRSLPFYQRPMTISMLMQRNIYSTSQAKWIIRDLLG